MMLKFMFMQVRQILTPMQVTQWFPVHTPHVHTSKNSLGIKTLQKQFI